jgi:Holliday junction resolvasome RuvABC endonuclease subunit
MNKRIILGADISKSSTGCSILDLDYNPLYTGFLINKDERDVTSVRKRLIKYLAKLIDKYDVTDVVIEDVFGSVNFDTSRLLIILNECAEDIKMLYPDVVFDIYKIPNTEWKSKLLAIVNEAIRITGRHKEAVQEALGHIYNITEFLEMGVPDDVYDSLGIAYTHAYEINSGVNVISTAEKNNYIKNFRLGLISFYFLNESLKDQMLETLDDGFEHLEVKYNRTIESTVKGFYKGHEKTMLCLINIGNFKKLGLDLVRYGITDRVKNEENLYCLALPKQVERSISGLNNFKDWRTTHDRIQCTR